MAKKGQKKMKVTLSTAKNPEMLRRAVGIIDVLTKSGATWLGYSGYWNGMNYSEFEFFANPSEVSKIKSDVEKECGVIIQYKK